MPRYNFSDISDFEFEELCRDLMQEELGLSLELFTPGRDQGIDFRYVGVAENGHRTIIGQCKRWADGTFQRLLRHLSRDELPKVRQLAPERYILMTSVELNPNRKSDINNAFVPWIQSSQDIRGRDDLTGMLARFHNVERRHIKLWLTSGDVLDALLNSDIANRSDYALEHAERQRRLWVPNPSFDRVHEVLENNHVCIISGAPGMGKTMLADVLLAWYASTGYQPVAISRDIEEGQRAWRPDLRQIFVYDDFLGQVTSGELQISKNEPSDLARFLGRVRRTDNKRFILTTREYVLSDALRRFEKLSERDVAPITSIVSMEDYTEFIRAHILYNHLFFSELPSPLKTSLLMNERYLDVIRHPNYTPRVIEHIVDAPNVSSMTQSDFVTHVFATLDDPSEVWAKIFNNLPLMERRILQAVSSLPTEVLLDDVRDAVRNLLSTGFDPGEFMSALGVLEGTFIDIRRTRATLDGNARIVRIKDPSVRDYLWSRLDSVDGEAQMLLEGSIFFEQCVILYEGHNHAISAARRILGERPNSGRSRRVVNHEKVTTKALELITSPSPAVRRSIVVDPENSGREPVNLARRVTFLMTVLAEHPESQVVATSASEGFGAIIAEWEAEMGSPTSAVQLLRHATRLRAALGEARLDKAGRAVLSLITGQLQTRTDFELLVELESLYPELFHSPNRRLDSWSDELQPILESDVESLLLLQDDPDWIEYEMDEIRSLADAIGVDMSDMEYSVEDHIEQLQQISVPASNESLQTRLPEPDENTDQMERSPEAEIRNLFDSLR